MVRGEEDWSDWHRGKSDLGGVLGHWRRFQLRWRFQFRCSLRHCGQDLWSRDCGRYSRNRKTWDATRTARVGSSSDQTKHEGESSRALTSPTGVGGAARDAGGMGAGEGGWRLDGPSLVL